jgi:hypothetical protein
MAEQLARALVAGVLQADIEANVGALVPIDAN